MGRIRRPSAAALLVFIVIFELSAFVLLALRTQPVDLGAILFGTLMVGIFIVQYTLLNRFFPNIDRYILIIANMLAAIGMIVQYRLNPEIAYKQAGWLVIGMGAMVVALLGIWKLNIWDKRKVTYLLSGGGILLLAAAAFLGRRTGGASNWFSILGSTFQPSEFVKLVFVAVLAAVFAQPLQKRRMLMCFGVVGAMLGLLVLQRDLGAALLYAGTFLILLYVGTNKLSLLGISLLGLGGGAYASYQLFDHVRVRIAIWQNPWAAYESQGYQIVQGLMAIASGGLLGSGLGLGIPNKIPAYHTDFIFAVICEEFGIIFGVAMIAFYVIFIVRGALIALNCKTRFDTLLAFGCTAMITLQSFIIIGGVIKLIPLTGITLPFVSYGGSSMMVCMMLVGVLQGLAVKNGEADEEMIGQLEGSSP
ncbi:MAG: FtsW/RodA/SpoVE family cell cycle protein [Bacillota bacterium]